MHGKLKPGQHIHLLGIGGFGLSAIARILFKQGYQVSGSDQNTNPLTDALQDLGVKINHGHHPDNIHDADLLIISSAVKPDNPEYIAALNQNIPIYKRNDIIAELMHSQQKICIAGTHGKTTTTSMVAHTLIHAGQQPTYLIGGVMGNTGLNADVGQGESFIIEADEYDNMFLGLDPDIAIITSLEYDHPDFFASYDDLFQSFTRFIDRIAPDGLLIICIDDQGTQDLAAYARSRNLNVITYGLNTAADCRIQDQTHLPGQSLFYLSYHSQRLGPITLTIPGLHNILNATATYLLTDYLNLSFEHYTQAMLGFISTGRRFDIRADLNGFCIVDDYAHHPTAIKYALAAAKQFYPEHQLVAIWQPHTYSRTRELLDDYALAFHDADQVLVTEIYASREQGDNLFTGAYVADQIQHPHVQFCPTFQDAFNTLLKLEPPALILIMSAGDAPEIGKTFHNHLLGGS